MSTATQREGERNIEEDREKGKLVAEQEQE